MLKTLCQSIGLSSILLVMNYGGLLGGGADVRMHVPFALGGIVAAHLADIAVVGLALFAVLVSLQRTRFYSWAQFVLAMAVPPFVLARTQTLSPFVVRHGLVPIFACAWAALVLLLVLRFPLGYRRLLRLGDAAGVFLAAFALYSTVQLLWIARWKPAGHEHTAAWEQPSEPARQHALLVWIVFDELSYDQVFEHRAQGLELPHFDALRAQSTLLTNVQPVGYHTATILPSLLNGKVVDRLRYTFGNRLLVHEAGADGWQPLDGKGSIFDDAQRQGWRTAAVGWYNPYCSVYGSAIDTCYWNNLDQMDGMMSQQDSWLRNAASPLRQMAVQAVAPARAERNACDFDVRHRLATELDLEQHAMSLLRTDQADLVFLHMPIPHSPNIWSRSKNAFTQHCGSSYLDNLVLADRTLGEFLETLQRSPRWKTTTLVVEGDHGWRIDLWNWLPAWTKEDEAASRGVFDPRPALLVHEAGQTDGRTVSEPWPLLRVHAVVEQVLHGEPVRFSSERFR